MTALADAIARVRRRLENGGAVCVSVPREELEALLATKEKSAPPGPTHYERQLLAVVASAPAAGPALTARMLFDAVPGALGAGGVGRVLAKLKNRGLVKQRLSGRLVAEYEPGWVSDEAKAVLDNKT